MHHKVARRSVLHGLFQRLIAYVVKGKFHFGLVGFYLVISVQVGDVPTAKTLHPDGYARQRLPFGIGYLPIHAFSAFNGVLSVQLYHVVRYVIGKGSLVKHLP